MIPRVVTARVQLRDDDGPTGEYGEPQKLLLLDGVYYPVEWIKSSPGILENQLQVIEDPRDPYSSRPPY